MTKDSGNVDKGLSFFKRAEETTRAVDTGKTPGICKAGQNIDEYKLVKCLGRGGMGEVWEAVQKSLKRTVALKVLLPGGGIREFAREATELRGWDDEAKIAGLETKGWEHFRQPLMTALQLASDQSPGSGKISEKRE